jgi:RNA polymerase sigma-70 factor (ECF subfamily)
MTDDRLDAATLFRRYASSVTRFLCALGVNRQDREDMVQDVFLVAHRRGGFGLGDVPPTTWLLGIALRTTFAARRRKLRHREIFDAELIENLPTPEASVVEIMESAEARRRFHAAIDSMETAPRTLLVSFFIEGRECEAIARDLGVPVGTVYSRLHKARKVLARAVANDSERSVRPPTPVPNYGLPPSVGASRFRSATSIRLGRRAALP